jgi:V-type H+-transporting ATPase subunit G
MADGKNNSHVITSIRYQNTSEPAAKADIKGDQGATKQKGLPKISDLKSSKDVELAIDQARDKVSEARKRKNRRLKQAKEEAQAEIERYKAEREGQFREHEARYAGSKGDVAARIDADAKLRVDSMNSSVNANKNKVITDLMEAVCKIEPKVLANYRP